MPSWYGPLRADEFFTGTPPMGVSYSLTCQCRRSFSCALFFSVRASSMILCDLHACGPDFSSYLLQAQASGAKVVALANAGGDMINATKQANEFGLSRTGQTVVSLLVFITDIHGLGLAAAHGLQFVTGFTGTVTTKRAPGPNASSTCIDACLLRGRPPSTPQSATISARSRQRALMSESGHG